MSSAHTLSYAIIAVYFLLMLGVGSLFTHFTRNSGDYFRSGSRATWWLVGTSLFMNSFSAWTFTGAAGVAYTAGWSVLCIFAGNTFGYLLNFFCYARWFRQMRATTAPEAIALRFGPKTSQFYAWMGILTQLPLSSLSLYGLAIFCSSIFQLDVTLIIFAIGLVAVLYSVAGGSWSVMATEFVQTLILTPMALALATVCLIELGGISGLQAHLRAAGLVERFSIFKPTGVFPNDAFTWAWGAALFLRNMSNDITLQTASRFFTVKDGREAAKASLLCIVLLCLGMAAWFLPPITARLLFPDEVMRVGAGLAKPAEAAYVVAGMKLLPVGFTGIMVVCMFAATMSSMDLTLNRSAAIVVRDIVPALCRRLGWLVPEESRQLRAGRLATLALGAMTIASAMRFAQDQGRGVFELMTETGALLVIPTSVPMILALLIRRTPPWAAIFTVCVGFLASFCSYKSTWLFGHQWNLQTTIFCTFTVGTIAFLATIPFWKNSTAAYRAHVEAFFQRMHTPVDFDREIGRPSDPLQLRWLGMLTIVTGTLLETLLLVPNPLSGRLLILAVGGFVIAVGLLMLWSARRMGKVPSAARPPLSP